MSGQFIKVVVVGEGGGRGGATGKFSGSLVPATEIFVIAKAGGRGPAPKKDQS